MIVKRREDIDHLADLKEVFTEVRKNSLKLNPEKCTFRVRADKFLSFYLTERGIEANIDKCRAVTDIPSSINNLLIVIVGDPSCFKAKGTNTSRNRVATTS